MALYKVRLFYETHCDIILAADNEQDARENAYIMAEHESEQIMANLQYILEPDVEPDVELNI